MRRSSEHCKPRLNGFLYQNGTISNIGVLPGSNNFSRGYAINDAGVIVGESDNNNSKAFRYANGVMTNLGALPGGSSAVAHNINNAGKIVGASSNGLTSRAYIYENGAMRDLGTLSGSSNSSGRGWAINARGDVVGVSRYDDVNFRSHATLWRNGGSPQDLGALVNNDFFSQAYGVNDRLQIVGSSVVGTVSPTSSTELYRAFLWDNGTLLNLGTLPQYSTFIHSEAKDINNFGQAVGYVARFYNSPTSGGAAFLYENGGLLDLNGLIGTGTGWTLFSAEGINNRGDIVGYGSIGGQTHAFLLTSNVPEPCSVALLVGMSLSGVLALRRHKHKPHT